MKVFYCVFLFRFTNPCNRVQANFMLLEAVLLTFLASPTLTLQCFNQVKCYGKKSFSLQYLLCDQSSVTQCRISYDYPMCSKQKGDSVHCSPDWFHSDCYCRDLAGAETSATGRQRCICHFDKRAASIVIGLAAVALLFAILTLVYSRRLANMRRAARTAQVEMRVLNRMLETNRNGLASIQEHHVEHHVEEKGESPPPQYQERTLYHDSCNGFRQDNGQQGFSGRSGTRNYQGSTIYNDIEVEENDKVGIAQASVV